MGMVEAPPVFRWEMLDGAARRLSAEDARASLKPLLQCGDFGVIRPAGQEVGSLLGDVLVLVVCPQVQICLPLIGQEHPPEMWGSAE